jgi:hypothetical protein
MTATSSHRWSTTAGRADQQVADAELVLQVLQQIEHLGLHRDVQRAHWLVGHDQARARHQGAGDGDALTLPAGELVRVLVQIVLTQPDCGQHRGGLLALLGGAAARQSGQWLADDALHGLARVQ